jgi:putative transposase
VRQWVLTMPYRLRYQMAWNHGLSRAVLRVYTRVLGDVYRRGARARGIDGGQTGMVTAVQRAGGALNANLHFHTLVLDGAFTEAAGGALAFHPARGLSDKEVAAALATIRHRVQRLLVRHGLEPGDDATGPANHAPGVRDRCSGVPQLWGPAAADRHAARSRRHPEAPRAPRSLPLRVEPRSRPA